MPAMPDTPADPYRDELREKLAPDPQGAEPPRKAPSAADREGAFSWRAHLILGAQAAPENPLNRRAKSTQ